MSVDVRGCNRQGCESASESPLAGSPLEPHRLRAGSKNNSQPIIESLSGDHISAPSMSAQTQCDLWRLRVRERPAQRAPGWLAAVSSYQPKYIIEKEREREPHAGSPISLSSCSFVGPNARPNWLWWICHLSQRPYQTVYILVIFVVFISVKYHLDLLLRLDGMRLE